MRVSAAGYGYLCAAANQELVNDAIICRDPEKLSWIALATSQAIQKTVNCELDTFRGAEVPDSESRRELHREIVRKVRAKAESENCGFIFITIILGAILSWLIQRLLDRLFSGEFNID